MYDYISANDDYSMMNYVFVFICSLLFSLPILVYIVLIKHHDTNRDRYYVKRKSHPSLANKTQF